MKNNVGSTYLPSRSAHEDELRHIANCSLELLLEASTVVIPTDDRFPEVIADLSFAFCISSNLKCFVRKFIIPSFQKMQPFKV